MFGLVEGIHFLKPSAHLHFIVKAAIKNPPGPKDCHKISNLMEDLVEHVRMKVLSPAMTLYCDDEGNEGITSTVILTTSHSSMHIWNFPEPHFSVMQFDLYSCAPFTPQEVLEFLVDKFEVYNIAYKFLNRDDDLVWL